MGASPGLERAARFAAAFATALTESIAAMLTIRRSQLAMLGAAMLQRFIDDETQRVATALGLPADSALRERVGGAVSAARADGLDRVDEVRGRVNELLWLDSQSAA